MSVHRLRGGVVMLAGLAFGALTVELARGSPGYSLTGVSTLADFAYVRISIGRAVVELAAGYSLLLVGIIASERQRGARFGVILIAASFAWFLTDWNNPGIGPLGFTIGLVLSLAAAPLVAHAAFSFPGGHVPEPAERIVLACAYFGALVVLGLAPALVYDRATEGCVDCAANLLLAHGASHLYTRLNEIGVYFGLSWSIAVLAVLGLRLIRSSGALRRVVWPVVAAGTVFFTLLSWEFAHSLRRGGLGTDSTDRALWLGEGVALVALALGVAWTWLRIRLTRGAVARLVVELVESPPPGGLRELLAASLGDPSLRLAYPLEDGTLVDASGRPLHLNGHVTPLVQGSDPLALLEHRAGLLADPDVAAEVVMAARLALENERLAAEARARLEQLRRSRARVVAAGDAERRRLERDLHDGAQQGLVAAALTLQLTQARDRGDDASRTARLEEADAELRRALEDLRRLGHGLFPAVLSDEGLEPALETLGDETGIKLSFTSVVKERLEPQAEAAAYHLVAETLRQSCPTEVRVALSRRSEYLVVAIDADGSLTDGSLLADRVVALDGAVFAAVEGGRVRIRAEIPCEL
jgi:signal transduction histidine kinase